DRKQTLGQIFGQPGRPVPVAFEKQGEAIAFSADGLGYYTIGEGAHVPVYRYDMPRASLGGRSGGGE
ncbi:MAG: hypothetical protein GWO24_26920, partial [Akkermansiaceae bacterium]|nr:hypothetical protein [Akkermansiaceae bacterium]